MIRYYCLIIRSYFLMEEKDNELDEIITEQVKVLIIGTSYEDGVFLTSEGASYVDKIKQQGVTVHMLNTHEAVKLFNLLPKEGLLACFHVNC